MCFLLVEAIYGFSYFPLRSQFSVTDRLNGQGKACMVSVVIRKNKREVFAEEFVSICICLSLEAASEEYAVERRWLTLSYSV